MSELHERIATSFAAQGLMHTLGATLALVADGEVHIALPFPRSCRSKRAMCTRGPSPAWSTAPAATRP